MRRWIALLLCILFVLTLAGCSGAGSVKITSVGDLANGGKVALYGGAPASYYLEGHYPKAEACYFDTVAEMIVALKTGKVDCFAMDEPTLVALGQQDDSFVIADGDLCGAWAVFAFYSDERCMALRQEFNAFLAERKDDGTLTQLQDKWFYNDGDRLATADDTPGDGSAGMIRVGLNTEQIPYCYRRNGKIEGYETELMYLFARERGYTLEITDCTWGGMYAGTASGKYDLGFGNIVNSEYFTASGNLSDSVCDYSIRLAVPNGDRAGSGLFETIGSGFRRTFIEEARWRDILRGLLVTLEIALGAIFSGTLFGFAVYRLDAKGNRAVRAVIAFFRWLIGGMPVLLLLLILYYLLFGGIRINGTIVAIIAFMLIFATGFTGQLQTAVGTIDPGQLRAALALGYSERKAFNRIILPQAVRVLTPAYLSSVTEIIKGTAVVGYIAVLDLTRVADLIRSRTFDAFFPLIGSTILYFILSFLLRTLLRLLLKRFDGRGRDLRDVRKEAERHD